MATAGGKGDLTGRLLGGRYRVIGELGRGGMGVVCRATDEVLGREVAVKVLRAHADVSEEELTDLRSRMRREARAAARIRHSGVITVHDVADDAGRPLIVMELIDGPSLDDVLRERGVLDPGEAAGLGAAVADALDAAHAAGVLHRDVKPANVLMESGGRVVLTDFGIASVEAPGDGADTRLTRSGELVGSLDYLAPERVHGQDPGAASDLWSLGMTLYTAVERTSPFRRESVWMTINAIVTEDLPEPHRAGPLAPVLRALMHKDPAARPSAARTRQLLEAVARGEAPTPAPAPRVAPATRPAPAPSPAPAGGADPPYVRPAAPTSEPTLPGVRSPLPQTASLARPGQQAYEPAPLTPRGPRAPAPADDPPVPSGSGRRRLVLAGCVAGVVLVGAGVGYALSGASGGGGAPRQPQAMPSVSLPALGTGTATADPRPARSRTASPTPAHQASRPAAHRSARPTAHPAPPATHPAAPEPVKPSCTPIGSGKYDCHTWAGADSYTQGGQRVGVLHAGTNYFFCQANLGRRETSGSWTNVWWGKTDDDSGNTGVWVSDVYISGGANDQPVPGLPVC